MLDVYITCRVTSTLYTADARFVLSGSDDGNVRIWKAHASEKLGVITARERAAIEYRESLKERWKMDNEVGKVQRYVFKSICCCFSEVDVGTAVGSVICRSLYTRLRSSSGRCWMLAGSRRSAGENIHGRASRSPRQRGRRLSLRSRHNSAYIHLFHLPVSICVITAEGYLHCQYESSIPFVAVKPAQPLVKHCTLGQLRERNAHSA